MPVTRVNYLIQASDDLQLAKDYIILSLDQRKYSSAPCNSQSG
jgi:hypothetical protein